MCFKNPLSKNAYKLPSQDSDDESASPVRKPFFAMKMIELEMELEQNCTKDMIHKLTELYSQAIEFFDDKDDPKCYDIQQRLHKLLKRPEVLRVLNSSDLSSENIEPTSFEQRREDFENRKKAMANDFKDLERKSKNRLSVSEIIVTNVEEAEVMSTKICESFSKQENNLESRLKERKKSMLERSQCFFESFRLQKSDMSGGFDKELMMQNEIEEFLETNFAQQTTAVAEVNVRYETEIKQFDGQGGVFAMVVEEMRKTKENEVQTMKNHYEKLRKEGIQSIKNKYMCEH
ncbi:hypothetical protein SteCoe_6 [Stentor coeruleus]|uniref:Uncharacterized protein n=1 Tax=Stentor coeruleus TaxID=5963 RepID=A0A1R2D4V3_9CILI|nr:hypothetical protein SteCoe_6 [Stentor coeruleus]